MKLNFLWIIGFATLFAAGWGLYRILKANHPNAEITDELSNNRQSDINEPEVESPLEEEISTEIQLLKKQLQEQRKELVKLQYQQDCGMLFHGISGCLQDMLGQASNPNADKSEFCSDIIFCARSEGLNRRIETRKKLRKPLPLTSEEKSADAETLRATIFRERNMQPMPKIVIPWDMLMEQLLPCVKSILQAAEVQDNEACKAQLTQLTAILAAYDIYPIWYQDSTIQDNAEMQLDFVNTPGYPIPVLYYWDKGRYIRVGALGSTGENIQIEAGENYG